MARDRIAINFASSFLLRLRHWSLLVTCWGKKVSYFFYCYQYSNSSTALNETDETFSLSGFKCIELFGTLKQDEREQRLLSFKAGKFLMLHMYITHVRVLHAALFQANSLSCLLVTWPRGEYTSRMWTMWSIMIFLHHWIRSVLLNVIGHKIHLRLC